MMHEVNIEALVGPTHHFGGWATGNIASEEHRHQIANPQRCALENLEKMCFLHERGAKQLLLPPLLRPDLSALRTLGFHGKDAEVIQLASREAPELFFRLCSAAAMWTANLGTCTPSVDTADHKVHITPANLVSQFHRSFEWRANEALLSQLFTDSKRFCLHSPLPAGDLLADEGAANQIRFCQKGGGEGLYLWVYGREGLQTRGSLPKRYPARQTLEALQALMRVHRLDEERVIFAQQAPEAIDSGVFHNDVIAVGHEKIWFFHEGGFVNTEKLVDRLQQKAEALFGTPLQLIPITHEELSLKEAVSCYLFNSQIMTDREGKTVLVAPKECEENVKVFRLIKEKVLKVIDEVLFVDLKQSMQNGGGPACLRLVVSLEDEELAALPQELFFDLPLYERLKGWIEGTFRETLRVEELADPVLYQECQVAFKTLAEILPWKL